MMIPFRKMFPYLSSIYTKDYIQKFSGELTFGFLPYVKSQVDVDILSDYYSRDILDYIHSLRFIKGSEDKKVHCDRVLRFFYEDMANMICSVILYDPSVINKCTISIDTVFPNCVVYKTKQVILEDTKKILLDSIRLEVVRDTGVGEVLLKMKGAINTLEVSDMLALACILYSASKAPEVYRLEVI